MHYPSHANSKLSVGGYTQASAQTKFALHLDTMYDLR